VRGNFSEGSPPGTIQGNSPDDEPMRRLDIALVVHDLHSHGGHAGYTKILADELSLRHNVSVFANRCERPLDARWKYHHVRAARGSALACVQTFPLGIRALQSTLGAFDIRHMQGYCGGQPNVVTAHICVAAYLKSLREISTRHRLSLTLMAAAERRFYHRYQGQVLAVSQKIALELKELYKVEVPITVIPHGVDQSRFNNDSSTGYRTIIRSELGIDQDSTMALYVGDLTKSHTHLKEVAAAAPEVEFVLVTPSRHYHWKARNVHIVPATTRLNQYYAAADAFVFPTSYDAFGMVILEAMASGLPVFSSDCAGAAELIHSGRNGFVIALDNWVETTVQALGDRNSLKNIGREAEKTARLHDWSRVVRKVEEVYIRTANRSRY
jgi:UDP-glucose:(heptosyl)LPS alpha-1,3-glucosyltransferase